LTASDVAALFVLRLALFSTKNTQKQAGEKEKRRRSDKER